MDHMKDIIDYRTMNYYRRRYEEGHKLEKEKKMNMHMILMKIKNIIFI